MATIGLSMIVKDEGHVIQRCLASVAPLLDYALIVDTGSQDDTIAKITDFFERARIAYRVIQEPWKDFATNRTSALEHLRTNSDISYCITLDADEVFVFEPEFSAERFKQSLKFDLYDVTSIMPGVTFSRAQLFRNHIAFRYRGRVHEFVDGPVGFTRGQITAFHNTPIQDSARNKEPAKTRKDAEIIEAALIEEKDAAMIARYTFYLGQSWRDCGEVVRSLDAYGRRSELAGWADEVCISFYNMGQLMERLTRDETEIADAYIRAWETCPSRAEPLYRLARYYRTRAKYQRAYLYAKHALTLERPARSLFVEEWIYEYRLLDEFSIISYWAGHYQESVDAGLRLLREKRIPHAELPRVRKNLEYGISRL